MIHMIVTLTIKLVSIPINLHEIHMTFLNPAAVFLTHAKHNLSIKTLTARLCQTQKLLYDKTVN